jgi:predicted ATPase/DNA-binding SARP family transcriptional activator
MLDVLGSLQITLPNGTMAKLESDRARALLAYLAVQADQAHRRDALIGLIWSDLSEEAARHNLRQALFNLRKAIGDHHAKPPYLFITRDEIQFNPASKYKLDLAEFDAHLAACESHTHTNIEACTVCAPRLQQAVDLYRGKFLQEFFLDDSAEFEEWALTHREATHQRALDALTHLANYYEQHGDLAATRRCALRQLELDPWREHAHRQMMRVFAAEGQRNAALAQFETCRRVLSEELGIEPSSETRELFEKIKSGSWKLEVGNWNHPPTSNLQLPTSLTPFLGRERELQDLGKLITDDICRCITLIAPGGMGKTRLAIQAASNQRNDFAHGVAFVQLSAINSSDLVIPAIAEAIGFSFYGPSSPRHQLINYLRDKQMLLVLDNLEQLMDAAELFVDLLQRAPAIKFLLTSREPLNVQGEWVFQVEGLQIPASDQIESSSAATLFIQRARRTRTGFAVNDADRVAIARLCRLVEGMPLALELAATWVKTLSVAEIVAEIERNLDFLSATIRDLPERHRSIRVVFDHSWRMLPADEQGALARLSVLRGDFQREAAEQIAGASLSLLSALVTKSLVRRTATGRYDLHELVRQYAAKRLSENATEETATRDQHSRYYLAFLQKIETALYGQGQPQAIAALIAENENMRGAWRWATQYHTEWLRPCAHIAYWYFDLRNLADEGPAIFENAIANAHTIADDAAREIAIGHWRAFQAMFAYRQSRMAVAKQIAEQSLSWLEQHGDRTELIDALWIMGLITWARGEFAESAQCLRRALAVDEAIRTPWQTAIACVVLGNTRCEQGDYADGYQIHIQGLQAARAQGDPTIISYAISSLSRHWDQPDRIAELEPLAREGVQLAKQSGNGLAVGLSQGQLAQIVLMKGDAAEAEQLCRESIALCRTLGDDWGLSSLLNFLSNIKMARGNFIEPQEYQIESIRAAIRGGFHANALDTLVSFAVARAKTGDAAFALAIAEMVLNDAATKHASRVRAEKLRTELAAQLAPREIAIAPSFDRIIQKILG